MSTVIYHNPACGTSRNVLGLIRNSGEEPVIIEYLKRSTKSAGARKPDGRMGESRDALLIAIAKARGWIDDIRLGRIGSFAEIAEREGQGERHIRLLAPLAFLSPRIIAAIVDGTAPADLTVTGLANHRDGIVAHSP
jgi:hypothetical protein